MRKDTSGDIQVSGKIDYILFTPDLCDHLEQVVIDDDADGSDHKSIKATFGLA